MSATAEFTKAGDIDAYLAALRMRVDAAPFDPMGRARISQLINKSNRFNLTTPRYDEADLAAVEADPDVFTMQVRMTDRFGDQGVVAVVICRPDPPGRSGADRWAIDTWLMSCRVLGRKLEQTMLVEILRHARPAGIRTLVGTYHPTQANVLVRDHYRKLGFTLAATHSDGSTVWTLPACARIDAGPMTVRRHGFGLMAA
jgi:FkbH-like protein